MIINDTLFNCDLVNILEELKTQLTTNGIQLLQKTRYSGSDIQVQCPYHGEGQEKKPSAGIRRSDGMFHCFACGEVHSLPEVISFCFGYTDDILGKFGWNWLLKNFATLEVEERKDVELDFVRSGTNRIFNNNISVSENKRNSRCLEYNSEKYVSEEELDKYRYIHPYWAKRSITDDSIIELFDLGFDRETNCITFPVRDIYGHTLFVARRSVNTKFFNYPEGVEKPLYGLYELELTFPDWNKLYPDIIVCESMIDSLTCWQYGKYAIALNGLGNELQFKQLRDLPCRKLILATDNDKAGIKARKRIRKNVKNKIITEYIFPKGKKDINELSKEEFYNLEEVF